MSSLSDDRFKGKSYSIRVNGGYPGDQKQVRLDEPFVLVCAVYKDSNRYSEEDFAPGAEKINDSTLSIMLIATDEENPSKPVWEDGYIILPDKE